MTRSSGITVLAFVALLAGSCTGQALPSGKLASSGGFGLVVDPQSHGRAVGGGPLVSRRYPRRQTGVRSGVLACLVAATLVAACAHPATQSPAPTTGSTAASPGPSAGATPSASVAVSLSPSPAAMGPPASAWVPEAGNGAALLDQAGGGSLGPVAPHRRWVRCGRNRHPRHRDLAGNGSRNLVARRHRPVCPRRRGRPPPDLARDRGVGIRASG